jgi:hypothetical protein
MPMPNKPYVTVLVAAGTFLAVSSVNGGVGACIAHPQLHWCGYPLDIPHEPGPEPIAATTASTAFAIAPV